MTTHLGAPGSPHGIDSELLYRIYGDGSIRCENSVQVSPHLPHLPRVGLELVTPPGFETLTWYGRGPHENYVDRKRSALVGRYTSRVDDQFTPYVYPSEAGGKEDVRWLALTNAGGAGLLVTGLQPLHIDALHYTVADLAQARHPYELTRRAETHPPPRHCPHGRRRRRRLAGPRPRRIPGAAGPLSFRRHSQPPVQGAVVNVTSAGMPGLSLPPLGSSASVTA